jgi:hypothetical protein
MFLFVRFDVFDFSLSLLNFEVLVPMLFDAALNIFLADNVLALKARLLGEFILIFWVWVKVMLVLVVILG